MHSYIRKSAVLTKGSLCIFAANKPVNMQRFLFIVSLLITGIAHSQTPIPFGQTDTIVSSVMGETTKINIYLPDGYHPDSAAKYPVIYVLDGALDEDFFHMAGLVQFSSFSWVNYIQPSIMVGIVSSDRKRDMTYCSVESFTWPEWLNFPPTNHKNTGKSASFMQYIETELIPYMESHYHCTGNRTLIGQSLAGLFATEVLLKKPTLFQNYIIMSPSLWWGNESLLKDAPKLLQSLPATPMQVYIAVGKEGKVMEQDARNLSKAVQKAAKPGTAVKFEFLPKENHGTILHQAVDNAFEWMTD